MRKFKVIKSFISFAFILGTTMMVQAQTFDEVKKLYPDEHAVILNYNKGTRIFLKDGQPQAETKTDVEILVLDDKANGMYNRYKIYHGSFNELKNIEAYTKTAEGKKIKVNDMQTGSSRSEGVFYDDVKETAFDFPALLRGATATVSYTEVNKDPHLFNPFYFVSYLPVVHSKFTVSYPADMQIKYMVKNDSSNMITVTEDNRRREKSYTFSANNTKPGERFSNMPSYSYYEPHIIVQIASYKNDHNETVNYLGNIDDLYKWYYGFIKGLDNTNDVSLKRLSDSLTTGITSQREKAKRIYQWVQHNIKYVAFEDGMEGFIPRRAAVVCNRRFGDCKDMSSILTALLQLAGVKAYFTWIGTRDIPYDYTDVALPITDNHMIAAVNIDNGWIFLDGTDPDCIFGLPSEFIQGKQALIGLSESDYKIIRVPEVESEKNVIVDSTFISLVNNGIKGSSSVYYNGYFASDISTTLSYKDANDTRDYVKTRMGKASNKFILGDYTINKINAEEKPINIKADFEVPDYSKKIGDELYINMNLEKFFTNNSIIDTAKRKVGMENDFKYVIKQYTILNIPHDYKVSYLPEDYDFKDDILGFSIKYTRQQDKIIAMQEWRNNYLLMQPKDFAKWNKAIKQILTQYKEQVVLQKK